VSGATVSDAVGDAAAAMAPLEQAKARMAIRIGFDEIIS
jgi:hypothetical protein